MENKPTRASVEKDAQTIQALIAKLYDDVSELDGIKDHVRSMIKKDALAPVAHIERIAHKLGDNA